MYLFVYSRQSNLIQGAKLFDLLEKNQIEVSTLDRFHMVLENDFWFALCTDLDEIVAETVVSPVYLFCSQKIRYHHITDLFVPESFRGYNYAMLLILNILYHFGDGVKFRIEAYINNIPAYRSYSKIFGDPFCIRYGKAYFSNY